MQVRMYDADGITVAAGYANVKACVMIEDGNYQLIYEADSLGQQLSVSGKWPNRIVCEIEAVSND